MTTPPRLRAVVRKNITPGQIITAALQLTHTTGLDGWTVRQLATAIDAYPAVIYHHVGDREAVATAVVDRVATLIPAPSEDADLTWRRWLWQWAAYLRAILLEYPGVARRLAMWATVDTGPAHTLHRTLTGILRRGGFDADSPTAARLVLTTATLLVSVEDDRQRHGGPSSNTFAEGVQLYTYGLDRCLDGLAATLTQLASAEARSDA